uniref:Uncharacterized protein n=1 Tax=Oryza brachyantha TaxID=4533 RepID=J3N7N4_ORYBR
MTRRGERTVSPRCPSSLMDGRGPAGAVGPKPADVGLTRRKPFYTSKGGLPSSSALPPSPFEHKHGVTPLEGMGELDPDSAVLFHEGLEVYDGSGFAAVLRECGGDVFAGVESLTDCGGGEGHH